MPAVELIVYTGKVPFLSSSILAYLECSVPSGMSFWYVWYFIYEKISKMWMWDLLIKRRLEEEPAGMPHVAPAGRYIESVFFSPNSTPWRRLELALPLLSTQCLKDLISFFCEALSLFPDQTPHDFSAVLSNDKCVILPKRWSTALFWREGQESGVTQQAVRPRDPQRSIR